MVVGGGMGWDGMVPGNPEKRAGRFGGLLVAPFVCGPRDEGEDTVPFFRILNLRRTFFVIFVMCRFEHVMAVFEPFE